MAAWGLHCGLLVEIWRHQNSAAEMDGDGELPDPSPKTTFFKATSSQAADTVRANTQIQAPVFQRFFDVVSLHFSTWFSS